MTVSAHFASGAGKVLGVVEVLVQESFQAIANHFRAVVAKALAKSVELTNEVGGGSNAEHLIAMDGDCHKRLSVFLMVFYLVDLFTSVISHLPKGH